MYSEDTCVALAGDTLFRVLDGEAIILSLRVGKYYGLDVIGTRFIQLIMENKRLGKVHQILSQEYDAPASQLWEDLVRLVADLRGEELIVVEDA
jgi:hypothetical protein